MELTNKDEIGALCDYYGIENYQIVTDKRGVIFVEVDGDVNLSRKSLTEIPIRFGSVYGYFSCSDNYLVSLKNAPVFVKEYFDCSHNRLPSLQGAPTWVNGTFACVGNNLRNLKYSPIRVGHSYICSKNNLKTLKGITSDIRMNVMCDGNDLQLKDYFILMDNGIRLNDVIMDSTFDRSTIQRSYTIRNIIELS